jgi:hypothetical protein
MPGETGSREGSWKRRRLNTFQLFDHTSFYTEPPAQNHFAETDNEPVVLQITGFGPSSTEYVDATQDPQTRQAKLSQAVYGSVKAGSAKVILPALVTGHW